MKTESALNGSCQSYVLHSYALFSMRFCTATMPWSSCSLFLRSIICSPFGSQRSVSRFSPVQASYYKSSSYFSLFVSQYCMLISPAPSGSEKGNVRSKLTNAQFVTTKGDLTAFKCTLQDASLQSTALVSLHLPILASLPGLCDDLHLCHGS